MKIDAGHSLVWYCARKSCRHFSGACAFSSDFVMPSFASRQVIFLWFILLQMFMYDLSRLILLPKQQYICCSWYLTSYKIKYYTLLLELTYRYSIEHLKTSLQRNYIFLSYPFLNIIICFKLSNATISHFIIFQTKRFSTLLTESTTWLCFTVCIDSGDDFLL